MKQIYIAGPDVFSVDWYCYASIFNILTRVAGYEALLPVDNEAKTSHDIYTKNLHLIEKCDAVIANCSPFRGPSLDAGTAFEIGYAKALKKPIFVYTMSDETYLNRVKNMWGVVVDGDDIRSRIDNTLIENFNNHDNLMIEHSPTSWVVKQNQIDAFCKVLQEMRKAGI